jgi:hypothetical protein
MRFKIILNKDAAFVDYINILLNNQNYFMPVELTEPLDDLYSVEAKYDEKFKIIKNKYIKNFEMFIENAHGCFIKYWKLNYNKLNDEKEIIEKILENYGEDIIKSISELTKVSWKTNTLIIILTLRSGGMNDDNTIFLGINKKFRRLYIETLIHELIHANTHFIISKAKLSEKDEEIAATLITNKIIKRINKKYKIKLKRQVFSYNLNNDLNKKYLNYFVKNSESFIELVKKINQNTFAE